MNEMNEQRVIKRSESYRQFRLAVIIAIGVILVVLTFIVLRGARQIFGMDMTTFGWTIRLGVVALTAVAIVISGKEYRGRRYAFRGNQLVVTRYWLGSKKSEKIISIDPQSVKMISLKQGYMEKWLNSGTVVIEVDSNSQRDVYKLEHIDNPQQVLRELSSQLKTV